MMQFARVHYLPDTETALTNMLVQVEETSTDALGGKTIVVKEGQWQTVIAPDKFGDFHVGDVYASWEHTDGTQLHLYVEHVVTYDDQSTPLLPSTTPAPQPPVYPDVPERLNPFIHQELFVVRRVCDAQGHIVSQDGEWSEQDRQLTAQATASADRQGWWNDKDVVLE